MLIIKRKVGESITINGDISILLKSSNGNVAQLGISAPRRVPVMRNELISKEVFTTNALARLEGSSAWTDYGPVSLHDAARLEAIQTSRTTLGVPEYEWLIEARRENDTQVLTVRVKTSIAAEVLPDATH
jgi:carbon storage regulator CsrA